MDQTVNSSEMDRLRRILEESNVSSVSSDTSAANGSTGFASRVFPSSFVLLSIQHEEEMLSQIDVSIVASPMQHSLLCNFRILIK